MDKEVYPNDFVSLLDVRHGSILGRVVKFFTQVWCNHTSYTHSQFFAAHTCIKYSILYTPWHASFFSLGHTVRGM